MDSHWDFDCPQYINFCDIDSQMDEKADTWFECKSTCEDSTLYECDTTCNTNSPDNTIVNSDEETSPNQIKRRSSRLQSVQQTPIPSETSTPARSLRNTPARMARKTPRQTMSGQKDSSAVQPAIKKARFSSYPAMTLKKKLEKIRKSSFSSSHNELTLPRTPQVLKRTLQRITATSSKLKSSEQIQLDQMKQYRRKMQEMNKETERRRTQALKAVHPPKKTCVYKPTVPAEFHFATDARIKNHSMATRSDHKDFVSSLRTDDSFHDKSKARPKITKPEPFQFKTDTLIKRRSVMPSIGNEKFRSNAEIIAQFQGQLPSTSQTNVKGHKSDEPKGKHLTHPHTPNLKTSSRKRKASVISHEMKEQSEYEEIKKYKFKANPVNEKIMKFPVGIKKLDKAPMTKIEPFAFESDKLPPKKKKEVEPEKYEFHAQPVPIKILSGPTVTSIKKSTLTMPQSPAFALKQRAQTRVHAPVTKPDTPKPIKAKPVPHMGVPFMPKLDKKRTEPKPFTFDERDKTMLVKKEEKIKEELESILQVPKFKAQSLPSKDAGKLPEKSVKPPTNPEPFNLLISARGEQQAEKWKKQVEDELKQQREQRLFKAQPADVLYKKSFEVKSSNRPLTNISSIELNTDRRAKKWEELAKDKNLRQQEIEAIIAQQEMEEQKSQQMAIAHLRKQMVHKAQPIAKGKPLVIKPSDLDLTEPRSPRFSARLKSNKL